MRRINPSLSPSGWNCVAQILLPTRNICTWQTFPVINKAVQSGTVSQASLWPGNTFMLSAKPDNAKPDSIGSALPASVFLIFTILTGSQYLVDVEAPRYQQVNHCPNTHPGWGSHWSQSGQNVFFVIQFNFFLYYGLILNWGTDIKWTAMDNDATVQVQFKIIRSSMFLSQSMGIANI